jgi:hypothetical protein
MTSDNILGEKIYEGKGGKLFEGYHTGIYRNGIAGNGIVLLWNDAAQIYVSGSVHTTNWIPTGEFRTIRIVDSHDNEITLELSAPFRMNQENRDHFNEAYSFILKNIFIIQWTKFQQVITSGEHYSFGNFNIAKDGLYISKVVATWKGAKEGFDIIETPYIKNSFIQEGYFYIQYQVPKKNFKLTTERMGEVKYIPNIHIVRSYIQHINTPKTQTS